MVFCSQEFLLHQISAEKYADDVVFKHKLQHTKGIRICLDKLIRICIEYKSLLSLYGERKNENLDDFDNRTALFNLRMIYQSLTHHGQM